MTGSSKHPPGWRLWHPSQGIVFQQPLYPALDAARFFTEASGTREADTKTVGAADPSVLVHESKVRVGTTVIARRRGMDTVILKEETVFRENKETILSEQSVRDDEAVQVQVRAGAQLNEAGNDAPSTKPPEAPPAAAEGLPDSVPTPFTPLDYKMSDEIFQAARRAEEGTGGSFWSYSFYRGPDQEDGVKGKVRVHYCKNAHVAERELQHFVSEKYIGLDLEWIAQASRFSGARRNVSLVQLASQSRVLLLHLAVYPAKDELATPTLRKIIEDPNITKLGVWIKGDCTRLQKYLGINARSMFELSHLFKQVKYSASQPNLVDKKLVSLATQCQEVFGLPMRKDQGVRMGDWSKPLDLEQIGYAASDAYAAIHLFAMLNHQREKLDPAPALPFHAEVGRPIPLPPGVESSHSEESDLDEGITDEALLEAEGRDEERAALHSEILQAIEDIQEAVHCLDDVVEKDLGDPVTSKPNTKTSSAKSRVTTATKAVPVPEPPRDPRVGAAEACVTEHKEARGGKIKVTLAALKAYFIWQANKDLDCEDVARMLRDPPLQTSTVAGYIMSSVQSEKLPYDNDRLKTQVTGYIPDDVMRRRFFGIWKAISYGVASPKE